MTYCNSLRRYHHHPPSGAFGRAAVVLSCPRFEVTSQHKEHSAPLQHHARHLTMCISFSQHCVDSNTCRGFAMGPSGLTTPSRATSRVLQRARHDECKPGSACCAASICQEDSRLKLREEIANSVHGMKVVINSCKGMNKHKRHVHRSE